MFSEKGRELILRYQPRILMDRLDPFPVRLIGCTVFPEPGMSPSFSRLQLDPKALGAKYIIEYAYYFDYDIQHLYDLEHIWVMVSDRGHVTECWSSYHGMRMRASGLKSFRLEGDHPVLYCQPGKHAFLPDPELFRLHCQYDICCRETAGGGLLVPGMLQDRMTTDQQRNEKIRAFIRSRFSFEPSEDYVLQAIEEEQFIPWPELLDAIPRLVEAQLKIIEG